jgi:hypothetical protein
MVEEKKDVIITYNDRDFKAEDLSEEQANIAGKLNAAQRKLQRLQEAYEDYVMTADYFEINKKAFADTIEEDKED